MGFDAKVKSTKSGEKVLDFGVSGLLYNSDVLMYDRQTNSLWSQIDQQAISGPMKGATLNSLPISTPHGRTGTSATLIARYCHLILGTPEITVIALMQVMKITKRFIFR